MLSMFTQNSPNSQSSQSIQSCDFNLEPLKHNATEESHNTYKLNICFYSDLEKSNQISSRTVLIRNELQATASNVPVCDIYSFNGIGSSKNSKLFSKKNFQMDTLTDLNATINTFLSEQQSGHIESAQVLFVLDLKVPDPSDHTNYKLKEVIAAAEEKFLTFLQNETDEQKFTHKEALSFKEFLKKAKPQYLIAEGSIKADLIDLNFLSPAEKSFLQTRDGSSIFCQLIEFMMNAFKRGEEIVIQTNPGNSETVILSRERYFKKIDPNAPDYCPTDKSITFYPRPYKEIALYGIYTQTMQRFGLFNLETKVHEHDVVEMTTVSNMQQSL